MNLPVPAKDLHQTTYDRKIRIINETINEYRVFTGTISIPDPLETQMRTDNDLLYDIRTQFDTGKAAVYWVDGSRQHDYRYDAILGAGVAWLERNAEGDWSWTTRGFALGRDTGSSEDAELFAIAAAFRLAVDRTQTNEGDAVEVVRILSDCMAVLQGLDTGTITHLGPAVSSPWALQDIYDFTDFLVERGTAVQLVWLKGHAHSEGNRRADGVAHKAVLKQMCDSRGRSGWVKREDVPRRILEMGSDSVEEWYWRVNKTLLLAGKEEGEEESEEESEDEDGDTMSDGSANTNVSK
jgi:ribonuclease HI